MAKHRNPDTATHFAHCIANDRLAYTPKRNCPCCANTDTTTRHVQTQHSSRTVTHSAQKHVLGQAPVGPAGARAVHSAHSQHAQCIQRQERVLQCCRCHHRAASSALRPQGTQASAAVTSLRPSHKRTLPPARGNQPFTPSHEIPSTRYAHSTQAALAASTHVARASIPQHGSRCRSGACPAPLRTDRSSATHESGPPGDSATGQQRCGGCRHGT